MNKLKILQHFSLFTIIFVVLLLFFIHTAAAVYEFDGTPYTDQLKQVEHGSVTGGVIVDGGHGLGVARGRPYEQVFSVPDANITFSRLYVGVWGGTKEKTGTLDTTFNDHEFNTLDLKGDKDTNPEVYCSGHGVYWIAYDTIDHMQSGTNKAVARTSGDIDGRVYCIILVTVYEDDNGQKVDYWINEGNPNLHDFGWSGDLGSTNDEAYVKFSGISINNTSAARLTVAYLCGTEDENDYLYFNNNKLNGDDVAASRDYFNLLTFDVSGYLEKSSEALFERGDEDYIHPVLAVLTVYSGESNCDWRDEWMGENSDGGFAVTTTELQDAIHHWLEDIPVRDHVLTTQDLQEVIAIWLSSTPVDRVSSSVSMSVNIKPVIALEITPESIYFGKLSPGETSGLNIMTLMNKGTDDFYVTTEVTDREGNLFKDGVLLDSSIWTEFTASIAVLESGTTNVSLKVPDGYSSVGLKNGTLVFWAQAENP